MSINLPAPDAGLSKSSQAKAESFYRSFKQDKHRQKLVFGFNRYAQKVMEHMHIDGIVDDFTTEKTIAGLPVLKRQEVSSDALVLILSGGRPLTAAQALSELGIEHLDYFSFQKVASEPLLPLHFNEGFQADYQQHHRHYQEIARLLSDETSKETFEKLVQFRLTQDIKHLEGFTYREQDQYFEPFLNLNTSSESFADIGGFDGYTSEYFIRLCPEFDHISLFEPDPSNMERAKQRLAPHPNIEFHECGLGEKAGTFKLTENGSGSSLSQSGEIDVDVISLDSLNRDFSFIKMDIEGAELAALRGARETIRKCHPKIAIAVYHCLEGSGPFWQIPEEILSIRSDYKLYLRHYTESIYETVMFFVPIEKPIAHEN